MLSLEVLVSIKMDVSVVLFSNTEVVSVEVGVSIELVVRIEVLFSIELDVSVKELDSVPVVLVSIELFKSVKVLV